MKRGVYAGSFDPPTNGHLWMMREGSKLFNKLTLAVGTNPQKKYLFSVDERVDMLKRSVRSLPNVDVCSFENQFLVKYAEKIGADYILRGIRSERDYDFEREMRYVNRDINPKVETIFLIPPKKLSEVSSSLVKELVGPERWENEVKKRVPTPVYKKFLEKFDGNLNEWNSLWERIEAKGDSKKVYEELRGLYSKPHRAYHNMVHIDDCLKEFQKARHLTRNADKIEIALWFHDSVYNTHRNDSEEKSAALAEHTLTNAGLPNPFVNKVKELIIATKHDFVPIDNDERLVVDIDLSSLGKSPKVVRENGMNIREEFSWASNEVYKQGRKKFLERFLDREKRPSIYCTEFFKQRYENSARKNLEASIKELSN